MWTMESAPALSDWERAERAAAMEHAARLVARGASIAAAAEACGVSEDAVRHRVARAGTASRLWTAEEDARMLRAMAECGSWREVAEAVGTRSVRACKLRANALGTCMSKRKAEVE